MAEYIEREAFRLWVSENNCADCGKYDGWKCRSCWIDDAMDLVDEAPTADVVPKSEYDAVVSAVDNSTNEFLKLHDAYQEQKVEIEALRSAANSYKMHYDHLAREIFEEIEGSIAVHAFTSKSEDYADGMYDAIEWVDSKIAELKKKYTEGEK